MSGRLLAIARGALSGYGERKQDAISAEERKRKSELETLQALEQLGNSTGFSLGTDQPDPAAIPAPTSNAPQLGVAHQSIMDAARGAWKSSAAGDTPGAPAAAAPAAPKPATSPLTVAHVTLGGKDTPVNFDPSQTPGAKRVARDRANAAAHQKLSAIDDTTGEYDPANDYVGELGKVNKRRQIADALVKTGEFTQEQADIYAKTGEDLAEHGRKKALQEATISQKAGPKAPTPGTPAYYEMVRRVAQIRAANSKGGANADPAKKKETWVRSRTVELMRSPGKDPDLGTPLPGLSREEAISQAGDEWDAVVADVEAPASSTSTAATARTAAPETGPASAKIKTLNAQYKAALERGVDEDQAWTMYQSELAKIKAGGGKHAPGK